MRQRWGRGNSPLLEPGPRSCRPGCLCGTGLVRASLSKPFSHHARARPPQASFPRRAKQWLLLPASAGVLIPGTQEAGGTSWALILSCCSWKMLWGRSLSLSLSTAPSLCLLSSPRWSRGARFPGTLLETLSRCIPLRQTCAGRPISRLPATVTGAELQA